MITRKKLFVTVLTTLALAISIIIPSLAQDAENAVPLQFVNHIQAGLIEQDAFIANEDGTVQRITAESPIGTWYQPVYATAEEFAHDPFGLTEESLQAQEAGAELGFTMGDWLSATATGAYAVDGESATLSIDGTNLVANGVYTVWCSHMAMGDNPQILDLPCGADDGTENTFVADADGNSTFVLENMPVFAPVTGEPSEVFVIALAYHSDGQTYGAHPGAFGFNSHVQIFAMIMPDQLS